MPNHLSIGSFASTWKIVATKYENSKENLLKESYLKISSPYYMGKKKMSTLCKMSSSSISVVCKVVNEAVAFGWKIK